MSSIASINCNQCAGASPRIDTLNNAAGSRVASVRSGDDAGLRSSDSVNISSQARELSERAPTTAPVRKELVARVRAEIAADTYLSEDKLQSTADRIVKGLNVVG